MAEGKIIPTDRGVANLSLSSSGQYIVRDAELAGFFIMVGKQKKTFMVQADLRTKTSRRSLRVKIGVAGGMTAQKARAVAAEVLGTIARGKDPRDGQEKAGANRLNQRCERLAALPRCPHGAKGSEHRHDRELEHKPTGPIRNVFSRRGGV
jgi:hypothetical protein